MEQARQARNGSVLLLVSAVVFIQIARSASGESVLIRAVRIFEAFTPDETVLSVTQIARRARLHPATASRLVAELAAHGLLAREPDRQVRVGVRLWELALRASPALGLREAAMPFMEDAHAVLGHHVQLGVLDGGDVLFLERLSAPGAVSNYTRVAGRLPLHVSSSGLVLLAFGDRQLQEPVLAGPLVRTWTATRPGTSASAWACTSAVGQHIARLERRSAAHRPTLAGRRGRAGRAAAPPPQQHPARTGASPVRLHIA
jgi:DNA-binding IclR family transcriptional regulator